MLILWSAIIAAVPSVTVGPDSAMRAPLIEAPITRVTVFEGRARVLRRATVSVTAGATTWRLPDLPGLTDIGAIRVSVSGAGRLLRLEASPVERDRLRIEPAAELLDRLDALDDTLRRLALERAATQSRGQFLAALTPAPAVDEAAREGRPAAGMFAEAWGRVARALSTERQAIAERIAALDAELRTTRAAREDRAAELGRLDLGGVTERVVEAMLVIEAGAPGKANVELEYFVPGARWRPAYELHFFADEGRAELAAYGMVTQATGEDWSDVELQLSTAMPSFAIALPKLMTWTLGEAKEWRPTVYPRTTPPQPETFQPPVPRASVSDYARVIERTLILSRLGNRDQAVATGVSAEDLLDGLSESVVGGALGSMGGRGGGEGQSLNRAKRALPPPAPPPPPPPPAPVVRSAPRITRDIARTEAKVAEMAPSAQSASMGYDKDEASDGDSGGMSSRSMALFDAPAPPPEPVDPTSPAALAGGLDHVYVAAAHASITTGAEAYRTPLAREAHPVTAFYEATPALAPQAYLRATVTNRSALPILGGPVGIFLGSAYAGDGTLQTTGPGGTLALPLGGDEDVRLSRKILLSTETKGIFSKDDITTYRVQLEVASYKKRAVRVVVREPLPISDNEDVEVKLLSSAPKTAAPDEDGIVTWTIEVAPGKVAKLELSYQIKRPADFQLYQR